jgi:uncharacterized protein YfaS (alpha-2-macroglobulin family)
VANTTDVSKNAGTDLAYALYVLARNGAAPIGDLRPQPASLVASNVSSMSFSRPS